MGIIFATAVFTSVLVAPDVSGHDLFGTLYVRQFARKVDPSANSALISYPVPSFRL